MKKNVVLSIRGRQSYAGQEPDEIELVTEGTLEEINGGWKQKRYCTMTPNALALRHLADVPA